MSPEMIITIGQKALEVTAVMMLVLLIPALIVGLMVSMFQAATQINEITLSFIPKLLITLAVMVLAGPWLLQLMTSYILRLYHSIPSLIGS
jgi:flagellar biosynthetic protein FliQ